MQALFISKPTALQMTSIFESSAMLEAIRNHGYDCAGPVHNFYYELVAIQGVCSL